MGMDIGLQTGIKITVSKMIDNPQCAHGPTALFTRHTLRKGVVSFYACTASRDRKICPFYLEVEKNGIKPLVVPTVEVENETIVANRKASTMLVQKLISSQSVKSYYCYSCQCVGEGSVSDQHRSCSVVHVLSEAFERPTRVLKQDRNSKFQAQFLFTNDTVRTLLSMCAANGMERILCVGTPTLHEIIVLDGNDKVRSLLLDIDNQYSIFFKKDQFIRYNMFNHFFFNDDEGRKTFRRFINVTTGLILIIDPPFGGRIELLARTIRCIEKEWRYVNKLKHDEQLPVMVILPYYLEYSVIAALPSLEIIDYQLNYTNHKAFSNGPQGMKNGSAVRIYSNIEPNKLPLPESEGYTFCNKCDKWIHKNNWHCEACKGCMSKDGRKYKHCIYCRKCVKPIWIHCRKCSRCHPDDDCNSREGRLPNLCQICRERGHHMMECPNRKRKFLNPAVAETKRSKPNSPEPILNK